MKSALRLERERKRLEYEIGRSTSQLPYLRALVEGASDALLLVDEAGVVVEHNTAAQEQLTSDANPLTGAALADLFAGESPESRGASNHPPRPLLEPASLAELPGDGLRAWGFGSRGQRLEIRVSRADVGLPRPLFVVAARELPDAAMQARALHEAQQNLQSLNRALQLERQQEKAARLSSLSVLAGALSHDLNNSLAVVLGNLDLLEDEPDAELRGELLRDIRMGADAALALASRLVSFAKGPSFVLEPVVVQDWIARLIRAFRSSHRVPVEFRAPDSPVVWTIDERQMTQVVLNLLINAVQAAGVDHPIELTLAIESAREPGGASSLTVRDRGPGLPSHLGDRVFEPFVSTKAGGSGLGLASARRIVYGHHGELEAFNAPDGGACFRLHLPLEESPRATTLPTEPNTPIATTLAAPLRGIEVVVLDDEPFVLEMIRRALAQRGASVVVLRRGEEVIEWVDALVARGDADRERLVFVLDLLIEGGLDGMATLAALRARLPCVRAVACSGHPPDEAPADLKLLGFSALVSKPFRPAALVDAVLVASRADSKS